MKRILIYDLPLRLFHWIFAGFFLMAFVIAKSIDSDDSFFSYHMLLGLSLGFALVLRIIWGFIGTEHSRFSSFVLKPQQLFQYTRGVLKGSEKKWAGHNPASSWITILMFLTVIGLVSTGVLMTTGQKEEFEDIHEIFGNALMIFALAHVLGVIVHMIQNKDFIVGSMLDGRKSGVDEKLEIQMSRRPQAILFLILMAFFAFNLYRNYDSGSGQLNIFGLHLQLKSE